MSNYVTPRYRISIDEDKCGNAKLCLKCVKTCFEYGPNCLAYTNKEIPEPDIYMPKSIDDIDYKVFASYLIGCDGCGKCKQVCPKECIEIITPEPQIPRALITKESSVVLCATLADGTEIFPLDEPE